MGKLVLHPKQDLIWNCREPRFRNLFFVGGIQTGKSTLGAAWGTRESFRWKNDEDCGIITAPTFPILKQATLPKFLRMNSQYGRYKSDEEKFVYDWGFTVYCRTAKNPESMEGISNVRWIWGDELGLMPRYFWENMEGRAARLEATILGTTTPYAMNWLWKRARAIQDGTIDDSLLVQCRSIDSPYFPKNEYHRQQRLLDPQRFAMKYEGMFGQMQGLVYPELKFGRSHALPAGTKFYAGVDWGHTHPFVITTRAVTPDRKHYRVDEYYQVGLISSEIIRAVEARHAIYKYEAILCDPSRPEYILELSGKGLPALAGNNDIRIGIDKHTALMREGRFELWEDMCPEGADEYRTYHYPEPEEIGFDDDEEEQLPVDSHNHGCDGDRYVTMHLEHGAPDRKLTPKSPTVSRTDLRHDHARRIEQLKRGRFRGHSR